jgi:hypothetical protein
LPLVDARRALLTGLFDHAPLFPPARMTMPDALAEDRRAQESEHAWLLGRFVCPVAALDERGLASRELALVGNRVEFDGRVYLEGVTPAEVASLGARAKVRCGGAVVPSVEELAAFVRACREHGVVFKATAGLHHAYPTEAGEHGFLNLLAAAVFGDEEHALAETCGAFALDAESFRWNGCVAGADELARVRETLVHSIGSCSFFEPVGELRRLGIL